MLQVTGISKILYIDNMETITDSLATFSAKSPIQRVLRGFSDRPPTI